MAGWKKTLASGLHNRLLRDGQRVLRHNWVRLDARHGFTMPSPQQYPYQWNWDSGFIAYGYAHTQPERAIAELRTLLLGQWANGMIPHIVFHRSKQRRPAPYFPGPSFWQSRTIGVGAPKSVATSGLTQPPMITLGVWHTYAALQRRKPKQARKMLEEFYPKLYRFHRYLLTARDPEGWGLVTIYHPWESGFDNSPRWDEPLRRIGRRHVPPYHRRDTERVSPAYRPSRRTYDQFVALALRLKDKEFDDRRIYPLHPFKLKDKVFSSITYLANRRLQQMASLLGDTTEDIRVWMERFEQNLFRKLWDSQRRQFDDYDLIRHRRVSASTIAGLLPLMTGLLNDRQVHSMLKILDQANFCGQKACAIPLAPSVGIHQTTFNHELYWRGPIWVNINWFLWRALRMYGLKDRARHQAAHLIHLIAQEGCYEYYSPTTGRGLGAKDFSWTAALVSDLLYTHPNETIRL